MTNGIQWAGSRTLFPASFLAGPLLGTSNAVSTKFTVAIRKEVVAGMHRWEEAGIVERIDSSP